jgi:hypothetical protein
MEDDLKILKCNISVSPDHSLKWKYYKWNILATSNLILLKSKHKLFYIPENKDSYLQGGNW